MVTTIQISKDIRDRLEKFKMHKRQSVNEVIEGLINNVLLLDSEMQLVRDNKQNKLSKEDLLNSALRASGFLAKPGERVFHMRTKYVKNKLKGLKWTPENVNYIGGLMFIEDAIKTHPRETRRRIEIDLAQAAGEDQYGEYLSEAESTEYKKEIIDKNEKLKEHARDEVEIYKELVPQDKQPIEPCGLTEDERRELEWLRFKGEENKRRADEQLEKAKGEWIRLGGEL